MALKLVQSTYKLLTNYRNHKKLITSHNQKVKMNYSDFVRELKTSENAFNSTLCKKSKKSKIMKFIKQKSFGCFAPTPNVYEKPQIPEKKIMNPNFQRKGSRRSLSISNKAIQSFSSLRRRSSGNSKLLANQGPDVSFKLNPRMTCDLRSTSKDSGTTDSGVSFHTIYDDTKQKDFKLLCVL